MTIENCTFQNYTGRTITYGFSEEASSAANRGFNWAVRNNTIVQAGNNATAIALFNIDGVVVADNVVSYVAGTTGRRGFNLDSSSQVHVSGNDLKMSDDDTPSSSTVSPWAIQISMSDAPVNDVHIVNNTLTGSFYGVVGLSQRNVTSITVVGNDIAAARGVVLNSGSAIPVGTSLTYNDVKIRGNKMLVDQFGVQLRDLHAVGATVLPNTKSITFLGCQVNGNSVFKASTTAEILNVVSNSNVIYDVKAAGNKLR